MEEINSLNNSKFPNNIFLPQNIKVFADDYTIYKAEFDGLYDLYDYLKANPKINTKIFKGLASINGSSSFAGVPYKEAVEDLINDVRANYNEFLELQNAIDGCTDVVVQRYQKSYSVAGGHLNIPRYIAGAPNCYDVTRKIKDDKFLRLFVALSYRSTTSEKQVFNRAIIITNIIKALEKEGYKIDLNTFEMSSKYDEISYIIVQLKKINESLNMQSLYKVLCYREFLRRILFRVLETMDVKRNWSNGYGSTCSKSFVAKVLNLNKNDIFFGEPHEMNILGYDLAIDFKRAVDYLELKDKIDVEKATREFSERARTLLSK